MISETRGFELYFRAYKISVNIKHVTNVTYTISTLQMSYEGDSVDKCRLLNIISVAVTLRASRGNVTTSTPYTYLHTIM